MPTVKLTGSLRDAVGGAAHVVVGAHSIDELFARLAEKYPALRQKIDEGLAVSINGEIYRDDWSEPIPSDAEVFLLPRIPGG